MKRNLFNIWFYVPAVVWLIFVVIGQLGVSYIYQIEEEGQIFKFIPLFAIDLILEVFVYFLINLIIAVCLSNSRKRVNIFGVFPIILLIIYSVIIGIISEGLMLFDVSIGLTVFYGIMYLLKFKFFSDKKENNTKIEKIRKVNE